MSVEAMAWALAQKIVAEPTARHVLLCLANYANQDGQAAFPSVERLRQNTGLSERTIRYKLDLLESLGAITRGKTEIATAYIGRADRVPVCYNLCMPRPANNSRGATTAPRFQTGCKQAIPGVQMTAKRGAPAAPKPSTDPSTEPPHRPTSTPPDQKTISHESGGGRLDLTLIPESLRSDVGLLVDGLTQAQDYADLLTARLDRDRCLSKEKKLRAPVFWLRSVIAKMNPDFYAAGEIARKRESLAAAELGIQEVRARQCASDESKASDIQLAQQLLDSLSEEELSQLADMAALTLPAISGSWSRDEVRSLVMNRSVGTDLAKVAVLKALGGYASRTKLL